MTTATHLPAPALTALVDARYAELVERCRAAGVRVHDDAGVAERLRKLLLASDFAYEALRRAPGLPSHGARASRQCNSWHGRRLADPGRRLGGGVRRGKLTHLTACSAVQRGPVKNIGPA